MSKKSKHPDAKDKAAKAKGEGKKGKKGKKGDASDDLGVSIAGNPRAKAQVRRAKAWAGLAGFGIAAYVSYGAHASMQQIALRSLVVGIVAYMIGWACSLVIWRHLMLAELKVMTERHEAEMAERESAKMAAVAAQAAANAAGRHADASPAHAPTT